MTIRVAINGYGRIGRAILRALYQYNYRKDIEIVAINGGGDLKIQYHLTRYDSLYGPYPFTVEMDPQHSQLLIKGDAISAYNIRDPQDLPWDKHNVDIVLECTGKLNTKTQSLVHIQKGARKVLLSAPGGKDVDATIVYGVNDHLLKKEYLVVSNASCTTNCLAPILKPLHAAFSIQTGFMTTIHAYTNDQVLLDSNHTDLRRARSATQSLIPTKTGAASSIELVLPELKGKLEGYAMRVPIPLVSCIDLTLLLEKTTYVEEVNACIQQASNTILAYNKDPLVSVDFKQHPASAIYDATQTQLLDKKLLKVLAWYDNEWGFANRMLDVALKWEGKK